MTRRLVVWLLLPVLVLTSMALWTVRYGVEHVENWQHIIDARLGQTLKETYNLDLSVGSLEGDGYSYHPKILVSDLGIRDQNLSIAARELSAEIKFMASVLGGTLVAKGDVKELTLRWADGQGGENVQTFERIQFLSRGEQLGALIQLGDAQLKAELHPTVHGNLKTWQARAYAGTCQSLSALLNTLGLTLDIDTAQLSEQDGNTCQVWVQYEQDKPLQFAIRISLSQLQWRGHEAKNLSIRASGHWTHSRQWSAQSVSAQFDYRGHPYDVELSIQRYQDKVYVQAPELNALDLGALILSSGILRGSHWRIVNALQPRGVLKDTLLTIKIPGHQSQDQNGAAASTQWALTSRLQDMKINPTRGIPGADNVDGFILVQKEGGYFHFEARDAALHFASIYENPAQFQYIGGLLYWRILQNNILLDGIGLEAQTAVRDWASGRFTLTLGRGSNIMVPQLGLWIDAPQAPIPQAFDYVPMSIHQHLPEWLYDDTNPGYVQQFSLSANIPIEKGSFDQMEMTITARVEDAGLTVPPGITVARGDGVFNYSNRELLVDIEPSPISLRQHQWTTGGIVFRKKVKGKWHLTADAPRFKGDVLFSIDDPTPLTLKLDRIFLPSDLGAEIQDLDFATLGETIPALRVEADHASYDELMLNQLATNIEFVDEKLVLSGVHFYAPQYGLGSGDSQLIWTRGANEANKTSISALLLFCDLGDIIQSAGECVPEKRNYTGHLFADLSWPDEPLEVDRKTVTGNLRALIKNSALVTSSNITALKIIEVLNVASVLWNLPEINRGSGETGVYFSVLQGNASVSKGLIAVDPGELVMVGRGGEFHAYGMVNLEEKQVEGEIGLTLPIRNNLGWLGWALGIAPIVGISTEILSQTFKKDLDKLFTIRYRARGPLNNIQLTRISTQSTPTDTAR